MKDTYAEYTEFAEQVKIKGSFYMPLEAGCTWPLIFDGSGTEDEWLRTDDGVPHVSAMPGMMLRELYEQCEGRFDAGTIQEILADYVQFYKKAAEWDIREQELLSQLTEKFPAGRLFSILIPHREESGSAERFPGRICGTAYLLYGVVIEEYDETMRILPVTKELAEQWGVCEQELYQTAIEQMPEWLLYEIEEVKTSAGRSCFVIKSEKYGFGLAALLYEAGPLGELAARLGQNMTVMPVSIHEAVAFPADVWSEKETRKLAGEISVFGQTIWRYSQVRNRLTFTDKEWETCMDTLKYGIRDPAEERSKEDGTYR